MRWSYDEPKVMVKSCFRGMSCAPHRVHEGRTTPVPAVEFRGPRSAPKGDPPMTHWCV